MMPHKIWLLAAWTAVRLLAQTTDRIPAVPLVTHDPYFSIWSMADHLTDEATKHWTGKPQPLSGILRVDDEAFRYMGAWRSSPKPAQQKRMTVTATRTIYGFEQNGVSLVLTFLTPAFLPDLEILSRPVTYLTFEVRSTDGKPHRVGLYFDVAAAVAADTPDQRTVQSRLKLDGLKVLRAGTADQRVLNRSGDDLRIDWGYLYVAAPDQAGVETLLTTSRTRQIFAENGAWPTSDTFEITGRGESVLAVRLDFGSVTGTAVSRHILLAYDDQYSIQYFQRNLRPWWRRNGTGAAEMLQAAAADYEQIQKRAAAFDEDLSARLKAAGGADYADIAITAYRQALAAHKLVADLDNTAFYFPKENFSNGCIATVDVIYPSAPLFLAMAPDLLAAQLRPVFEYASLPRWHWPYPPHDLGQYPLANGQVYGGGELTEEAQMPVEESGNLLLLTAALAKAQGNTAFARKYWPLLTRWAEYLRVHGFDPENQLNTDDFAGHMAHNTNLSLKAILALGAYSQLAREVDPPSAETYSSVAHRMALDWVRMADDGDHYRLAFDRPGTWSQKYNLVWYRLLGLNLFPPEVAEKEIAFYQTVQNGYGLPLDSRETYTKLDWILWTATMARTPESFERIIAPVHRFLRESPSRVPMTDWYWTKDGKQRGFQARSVVGGVFVKLLAAQWLKPN